MSHEITITWDASPQPVSGYNVYRGSTADNESNVPLNSSLVVQQPPPTPLTLTSVAAASAGNTLYTGTITGGLNNGLAGETFTIAGFLNGNNNGNYVCMASTITTLLLNNSNGAAETASATATRFQSNPNSVSFVDNTVFPGQVYFYEVTAVLNGIESSDSIEIRSAPVPFAPSPAAIELGTASSFGVLAGTAVTNTGATSVIGDVGVSPGTSITGFGAPASISGAFHVGDFVAQAAQSALSSAYSQAVSALNPFGAAAHTMTGDIGGQVLLPGVYKSASSLGITGAVTLDAQGDTNAIYIFQIGSSLTVAGSVVLAGGTQPGNVYWQVGSSATIGTGSVFAGTIMAQASITCVTAASINGRLLARTGAVTLDSNEISLFLTEEFLSSGWQPNHAFNVGQVIFDCATGTLQWVIVSGVSGSNRPSFGVGAGSITNDGTVVWTDPPSPVFLLTSLPPSPPNVPPAPPAAPLNPRITSEA